MVYKIIPPPSPEENVEAALRALEEARKFGITSVQDLTQPDEFEAYKKILADGNLTCRIYSIWPIDKYEDIVRGGVTVHTDEGLIKRGGLKGYADGSLGASTAWFFEPYWPEEKVARHTRIVVGDGAKYQPKARGVPFIGLYVRKPFADKPVEQFAAELNYVFAAASDTSLSICPFNALVDYPEYRDAFLRAAARHAR